MKVPIMNQSNHPLPAYATLGASGMDLRACTPIPIALTPGQRVLIATGLYMALPQGYEAQVRPRSGLALHHGITVLNSPGTIDADYRGEIKVLLINLSDQPFVVQDGDRIAQLVVANCASVQWQVVSGLDQTDRGTGGHGSTGKD
ncbi:dUTP diphosphatase [Cardinium endosymbiont of Sogatella furcifera]|uniref:dUTP diphosphatase n=1 Tax=Cardinium endosymbiont of Sogatella furcifera TaxID=650378 RepID=UPI000E0D023A|nr:dUTP diphosphatase [Cardinium endosymbiont of Sogatella furcifera]AXI23937.1 dUTP diphosphatase [Cardinium endosymbiont of Sogatella furcifera]